MIHVLITYRNGNTRTGSISNNSYLTDLRLVFLDDEGNYAASVEIMGYD